MAVYVDLDQKPLTMDSVVRSASNLCRVPDKVRVGVETYRAMKAWTDAFEIRVSPLLSIPVIVDETMQPNAFKVVYRGEA